MGEKYLSDEYFRIQEIYTTFNRETNKPIRIIAAGNPYSVYCALFTGLEVNTQLIKPGAFIVGDDYVIDCFQTPEELKRKILQHNPMYQFDDSYKRYAFSGESINDQNIRIHKGEPKGSKLRFVFQIGKQFLSIHTMPRNNPQKARFWVCKHGADWAATLSKRRNYYVFDFGQLASGAQIADYEVAQKLTTFKDAMRKRQIIFNSIDAFYMAEDVYMTI